MVAVKWNVDGENNRVLKFHMNNSSHKHPLPPHTLISKAS